MYQKLILIGNIGSDAELRYLPDGTTGCAAVLEGRDFIGIELNEEYMEIAKRRIAEVQKQPRLGVEE